jgi:paraquat-inducible protein B
MSDKPQAVAIGAFIIGALVIAIGALIFISGSGLFSDRDKVVMVFDGSVKGLSLGAPVALRGVQIGQVTDISIILDTDSIDIIMVVEAELKGGTIQTRGSNTENDYTNDLIARGMRAQLNTQSLLTGLLYIQLDFHSDQEIRLADIESNYTQIPTIPTDLERITREIASIDIPAMAEHLQSIAEGLSAFIGSESFRQIPTDVQEALQAVEELSDSLKTQVATSGPLLDKVLGQASTTVDIANTELPKIALAAQTSLAELNQAIASFESAMDGIDNIVSPDSAVSYQLNEALSELAGASRAIKLLAKTLEEQPNALLRGRSEDK